MRVDATSTTTIQTLDAGAWFSPAFAGTRVPLLTEALEVIQAGSVTLIERKSGDAAITAAHVRGLKDWVYTINESALALKLLALGVYGFNQTRSARSSPPRRATGRSRPAMTPDQFFDARGGATK